MLFETAFDSDRWKYLQASNKLHLRVRRLMDTSADTAVRQAKMLDLIQARIAAGKTETVIEALTMTSSEFEADWPGVLALRTPGSHKPLFVKLKSWS